MKKVFATIVLSISLLTAFSAHIKGGFFTYEYLGVSPANPANLRYKIILTVYMSCNPSPGQVDDTVRFTIFRGSSNTLFANPFVLRTRRFDLAKKVDEPCITNNQAVCYYTIVQYELDYDLPPSAAGYTISNQRCCRITGMENIANSGSVGNTYSIKIPGTSSQVPNAVRNSSPKFPTNDTAVVCSGSFFKYPITATDPDGDVLSYSFCAAYEGGSSQTSAPNPATAPPYTTVTYTSPYSGSQPMGANVTIDPVTGLISGIAPSLALFSTGEFVVTVCVTETRNGLFVGESRKELHVQVKNCIPVIAKLAPKGVTCDGFSLDFSNAQPLQSGTLYNWTFGDPASGANDTSVIATPTHVYTDTGVYKVILEVSMNGFCQSKDSIMVKVYPGFFPDFIPVGPFCKGQPITFQDNTTTNYGVPVGWRWNFGDPNAINDTNTISRPSYTYAIPGNYDVELIVGNTLGCIDTIIKQVVIADNPLLTMLSKDTIYCGLDTLQLAASGPGIFTWTPAVNILNANTATPLVYPSIPVRYTVTLNNAGCISRDSVKVTPKNNLVAAIFASTSNICEEDTLTLTAISNYNSNLSWTWGPQAAVTDPLLKVTKAFPSSTTLFTLTTHLGKNCVATATQNITVKKLAIPNAGPDKEICVGQTTAQLTASGGNTYQWLPAIGLSNLNIPNPVAAPGATTTYTVMVGVTGCAKTRPDSVRVLVRSLPPITLTNDTLICTIDTLQLHATGTGNFSWSPNIDINNLTIPDPLISPDVPVKYYVLLTDAFGCKNRDSVFVDVKAFVTINAGNDTTICRTDGHFLNTVSDALNYKWTPALYLNSDTAKRPFATPLDPSITYTVLGNIGKCQSRDQVTIRTVPYPQLRVSPDTLICFGDSAPLLATGGSIYKWTPSTFLTATNISNPVSVKPTKDTRYNVTVSDVLGCPKAVDSNVWVRIYPVVQANAGPRDTSIVIGQPLALNASGGDNYSWTPPTWLSNPTISNPVGFPEDNILYKLQVSTTPGCLGTDSIFVKVFKVPPSFYVPTGFSPNNDGRNDIMKPIMLGMRSLKYFRVFNRWGQMLFSTSQQGRGWDGMFKGSPQDPGTYVWMVEGETYTGEIIKKQGTVILLR
ncbi:MAG: PKD domain-containing protein [Ferruginibacter sp.]